MASGRGILSWQVSAPLENLLVCGHQRGTLLERSCHDESVGRISMESLQPGCVPRHPAVDSNLAQSCLQEINSPVLRWHGQDDAAAIGQQCRFPETDRADGNDIGTPGVFDQAAGLWPEHRVVAIPPQQGVDIERDHVKAF